VGPLFGALAGYDVWFTGLRRDQSPSRASLGEVEPFKLPGGRTIRKVSPLADWTTADVWRLREDATAFRCCRSTTAGTPASAASRARRLPLEPGNERSGRWGGQKLECGIHIQPVE
jgi:phosphoadenosine phosphosulfate reductase